MLDPTSPSRHYPIPQYVVELAVLHQVLVEVMRWGCSCHRDLVPGLDREDLGTNPAVRIVAGIVVQDILQVVAVDVEVFVEVEAYHSQDEAGIVAEEDQIDIEEDTVVVDDFVASRQVVLVAEEAVVAAEEAAAGLVVIVEQEVVAVVPEEAAADID
jgi:hypothetical protein